MRKLPMTGPEGIGDITSDAKGSAARYNTGKAPMDLVPARALHSFYIYKRTESPEWLAAHACLDWLARWQQDGEVSRLEHALSALGNPMRDAAHVFGYGKLKYAEWNWAKGFQWSVPFACAIRHLMAILDGELTDSESGHPHSGHVACNIIMLLTFHRTYPEGDDRPRCLG